MHIQCLTWLLTYINKNVDLKFIKYKYKWGATLIANNIITVKSFSKLREANPCLVFLSGGKAYNEEQNSYPFYQIYLQIRHPFSSKRPWTPSGSLSTYHRSSASEVVHPSSKHSEWACDISSRLSTRNSMFIVQSYVSCICAVPAAKRAFNKY